MNEVRIAIVGMGIGRANAGGYMRHPRARVTALCDIVEERMIEAEQALGLTDVKHYTSYQEMSRDPEIDAVFVGVPNQFHVPVALEAVSFLFYDSQHDALMVPWALRGALLNVGLVLYTLAFLWTIPPRSSSGSSPSRH